MQNGFNTSSLLWSFKQNSWDPKTGIEAGLNTLLSDAKALTKPVLKEQRDKISNLFHNMKKRCLTARSQKMQAGLEKLLCLMLPFLSQCHLEDDQNLNLIRWHKGLRISPQKSSEKIILLRCYSMPHRLLCMFHQNHGITTLHFWWSNAWMFP